MTQVFKMYTDGSFNSKTSIYGGGFYVKDLLEDYISGNDPELATARNVAGECLAVIHGIKALSQATDLHAKDEIIIYHDYTGLADWANGNWKAKTPVAKRYVASIKVFREKYGLILTFEKVLAHSGVAENEHVDQLAKKAVGLL